MRSPRPIKPRTLSPAGRPPSQTCSSNASREAWAIRRWCGDRALALRVEPCSKSQSARRPTSNPYREQPNTHSQSAYGAGCARRAASAARQAPRPLHRSPVVHRLFGDDASVLWERACGPLQGGIHKASLYKASPLQSQKPEAFPPHGDELRGTVQAEDS